MRWGLLRRLVKRRFGLLEDDLERTKRAALRMIRLAAR